MSQASPKIYGQTFEAQRTNGAGPQRILQLPKPTLRERLQSIWPHREDLTVAGREIKGGIVLHPIVATTILGLLVTLGLAFRSELNWQHDQLVILTTQKQDAEKAASQEHIDRANQESADKAWREKMTNQMNDLKLVVQNSGKSRGR